MSGPLLKSKAFGGTVQPVGFDFEITGDALSIILDPDQNFYSEPGAMVSKAGGIKMDLTMKNRKDQGFFDALAGVMNRHMAGERAMVQSFHNASSDKQKLVLAPSFMASVLAIDLSEYNGGIYCQRGAYLAAPSETNVEMHWRKKLGFRIFGNEEFFMQKISGGNVIFLNAGGTITATKLEAGEEMQVDTGCLVATTQDVKLGLTKAGTIFSSIFGNEGFVLANCTGPGVVWTQTTPYSRFVSRIGQELNRQGRSPKKGPELS